MLNPRMGVRLGVDMKVLPNFDWVDEAAGQSMSRVFLGGVVALAGSRVHIRLGEEEEAGRIAGIHETRSEGTRGSDAPATMKARRGQIPDGSGLSRRNAVAPEVLVAILQRMFDPA